ncbi:MAG: PTS sugar transporter subunit IIA [Planctomycetota bacterium]
MKQEDFDIASLAKHLHLTPPQVQKMAERGKLPGRRVGGKWRFSQAEIHTWFEDKIGVSNEQDLTEVEKVLDRNQDPIDQTKISISQLLPVELIFVPLAAKTKVSVIQKICDAAAQTGAIWDSGKFADAIKNREALHPTALGNGVALLHPRRPMTSIIGEPFLSLGITFSGIPFGGPRGVLTDLFFLIGSVDESQHLRVLARISRLIQQPEFLETLRSCEDAVSVWNTIKEFDDDLDG